MSSKEAKRTFLTPSKMIWIFLSAKEARIMFLTPSKMIWIFSLLAYLEVVRLLHVLQGSKEDIPDSFEDDLDFFCLLDHLGWSK